MSDALFELADFALDEPAKAWVPIVYPHGKSDSKTALCRDCGVRWASNEAGGGAGADGVYWLCGNCAPWRSRVIDMGAQRARRRRFLRATS